MQMPKTMEAFYLKKEPIQIQITQALMLVS